MRSTSGSASSKKPISHGSGYARSFHRVPRVGSLLPAAETTVPLGPGSDSQRHSALKVPGYSRSCLRHSSTGDGTRLVVTALACRSRHSGTDHGIRFQVALKIRRFGAQKELAGDSGRTANLHFLRKRVLAIFQGWVGWGCLTVLGSGDAIASGWGALRPPPSCSALRCESAARAVSPMRV